MCKAQQRRTKQKWNEILTHCLIEASPKNGLTKRYRLLVLLFAFQLDRPIIERLFYNVHIVCTLHIHAGTMNAFGYNGFTKNFYSEQNLIID